MTVHLSKATLAALSAELSAYGLKVTRAPVAKHKPDSFEAQLAALRLMTFKTASVKAGLIRTLKLAIASRDAAPAIIGGAFQALGYRLQDVAPWPPGGPNQAGQALLTVALPRVPLLTYRGGD